MSRAEPIRGPAGAFLSASSGRTRSARSTRTVPRPATPGLRISDDKDGVLARERGSRLGVHRGSWRSSDRHGQEGFCTLQRRRFAFGASQKLKGKVAGSQIESNGLILQFYSRSGGPDWRSREATWCRDRMPGGHAAARWAKDSRWRGRDGRKSGFIQAIMNMSLNLFFF